MAKTRKTSSRRARKSGITETVLAKADIGDRLNAATKTNGKFDRAKTVALAEENGIRLNPALDNGRTAMTTRNVLRARALKGERVVWSY